MVAPCSYEFLDFSRDKLLARCTPCPKVYNFLSLVCLVESGGGTGGSSKSSKTEREAEEISKQAKAGESRGTSPDT